jgi:hypothetical protein
MREKFTKPGSSIYYYLVEWEPNKLSWEDFRGKVLGATDPSTAADGSLRKEIFKDWKALGLASEPNVGDNGVHASASPFEALAERLNWMGATLEEDAFGKAMLGSGIPKETCAASHPSARCTRGNTRGRARRARAGRGAARSRRMTDTRAHVLIARPAWCVSRVMTWTKDPQVPFEGKKSSLFDLLEDLDYDDCLSKAQAIAGVKGERPAGKMQAYVFIKPHAVRSRTRMSRTRMSRTRMSRSHSAR